MFTFSEDNTVQLIQREKMVVMSFLAGLPSEFEAAKTQILSNSKISSLDEVFSNVLISRAPANQAGKPPYKNGGHNEYAQLTQLRDQPQPNSVSNIVESSKPNALLVSSPSKWVIDFGATDHMTRNSSLFSTFESHNTIFPVTLANGSQSHVISSGNVQGTPSISLSSVLSLPQLSFNLVCISKLTRNLNCFVSFYLDYCLF